MEIMELTDQDITSVFRENPKIKPCRKRVIAKFIAKEKLEARLAAERKNDSVLSFAERRTLFEPIYITVRQTLRNMSLRNIPGIQRMRIRIGK